MKTENINSTEQRDCVHVSSERAVEMVNNEVVTGDNDVATSPSGFSGVLADMNLSTAEFGFCTACWFGVFVVSMFISLEAILSEPSHRPRDRLWLVPC